MVEKETGLYHDFIIHPGETLQEIIDDKMMSQKELAIRCGVSEKHISTVLSGQKNISADFAKKLEYALGISSVFWMNLQNNYDEQIIKFEELHNITKEEIDVLKDLKDILVDYRKNNFIASGTSNVDAVIELRRLFNISNLLNISKLGHIGAFRIKNESIHVNKYVTFAWEKYCRLIDTDIIENEFDINVLKESIPDVKKIMFDESKDIIPNLKKVFAKCGIKFYLVKNYKGAPIQGYVRYDEDNRISLYLTLRGGYADIFWFSLFHEIAHILNGDMKNSFIDYSDISSSMEEKANELASEMLISKESYNKLIKFNEFSIDTLNDLARENNIKKFICIGRLMKDGYIDWYHFSEYRIKYDFEAK